MKRKEMLDEIVRVLETDFKNEEKAEMILHFQEWVEMLPPSILPKFYTDPDEIPSVLENYLSHKWED